MLLNTIVFTLYCVVTNLFSWFWLTFSWITLQLLSAQTIRINLLFYFFFICLWCIWGFTVYLDGLVLIFLVAELSLLLYIVVICTSVHTKLVNIRVQRLSYSYGLVTLMGVFAVVGYFSKYNPSLHYTSIYAISSAITFVDFFSLYSFFFETHLIITYLLTLIITLMSFFFIFLYYLFKLIQNLYSQNNLNANFIRKQQLLQQAIAAPTLRFTQS